MLIGVISDTHDNLPLIRQALALFEQRGVDAILHAGDYVAPFSLKLFCGPEVPFIGVLGNNDGERDGLRRISDNLHAPPHKLYLGGRRIVMTHEKERLTDSLVEGADLVIYGHTHEAVLRVEGGTTWLNPGEGAGWLTGRSTVALVDLDDMDVRILNVETGETVQP